jgi:hypothetical protein
MIGDKAQVLYFLSCTLNRIFIFTSHARILNKVVIMPKALARFSLGDELLVCLTKGQAFEIAAFHFTASS